jgi:hypothetical protein
MSSLDEAQRFWARVDADGGPDACWPWLGGRNPKGYAHLAYGGRSQLGHRVAWLLTYRPFRPLPAWAVICHTCDNPGCCNPRHLFLGTHADNVADRHQKGRTATGDRTGSRLHPERRPRGVRHGSRTHPEQFTQLRGKLSAEQARVIRQRAATGEPNTEIARDYGVSATAIWKIVHGRSWREEEA